MSKRQIDSTAYNKQLTDSIEKLRRIVDEKITPENIHYFSPQFIKKLDDVYNYYYDDGGMVNSIDNYKFNSLIRHLKSRKVEFLRNTWAVTNSADRLKITINIPEGWDGRNSFALPLITKYNVDGDHPDKFKLDVDIIRTESRIIFKHALTDRNNDALGSYNEDMNVVLLVLCWRYV